MADRGEPWQLGPSNASFSRGPSGLSPGSAGLGIGAACLRLDLRRDPLARKLEHGAQSEQG